ncbi:MAG: hypothetical protein ACOYO1_19835 [Bacteroidales bacterium]
MKKLIIFISTCCLLYSCDKYTYFDLPQDKIPLLKNNDIVYFQDSASSKIDTFCLDVRNYRQINNENGSFEHVDIYYNTFKIKTTFFILRVSSASVDGAKIYLDNDLFWQTTTYNSKKNNLTLQGVKYPTVDVLHINTYLFLDSIPNVVYYTYTNGIIRYEYKDGRVYDLVSK